MKTITNNKNQQVIRMNSTQFTLLGVGAGSTSVDIIDVKNRIFTVARVESSDWISLEVFVKNYFGLKI